MMRRKTCYFCENDVTYIDFKDPIVRNFISEKGRIVPAKISGVCHGHQRRLAQAIKRGRTMGILPYVAQ